MKCKHGNVVCSQCVVVTDAAKRIADTVNAIRVFKTWDEIKNGWMAFALSDGHSDWVVYPSKSEAVRHQSNEFLYLYVCFRSLMAGLNAKDAQLFLESYRHAYDNGMRLTEPEAPQLIFPQARGQGLWPM